MFQLKNFVTSTFLNREQGCTRMKIFYKQIWLLPRIVVAVQFLDRKTPTKSMTFLVVIEGTFFSS